MQGGDDHIGEYDDDAYGADDADGADHTDGADDGDDNPDWSRCSSNLPHPVELTAQMLPKYVNIKTNLISIPSL